MKPNFSFTAVLLFFLAAVLQLCPKASYSMGHTYIVDQSTPYLVPLSYFSPAPSGGDTIKILSTRTHCLKFNDLTGAPGQPIVLINSGGQVNIADSVTWGALSFVNCKYIKVSGRGSADHYYGFRLSAKICALAFAEYSSDCEVENIEMHHTLFFGIYAKKDFGGNPPLPYPQFNNLIIHDNYIHHVEEGMYIGETKSPGMEFRHVRIFNNVVTECMREAIQVANCVEDIEVYNNIGFNTGLGGLYAQCNILQIGGNTIGRYYNNILIHAPENGIICMGSGDVEVFSNYSSDNNGVYIDNREFNIPHSSISFRNNFFRNTAGTEVILNANELNELHIANNLYNTPIEFAKPGKPAPQVWDLTANQLQTLDSIRFSIANGIFVPDSTNPAIYNGLGPIPGLGYQMNGTPVLDSIGTVMAIYGDTLSKAVVAHTPDNDILTFNVIDLPEFVQFTTSGNGTATLSFIATAANKGVYYPTIMVRDSSHNQFDRETFKLAVKDPNNHDPLLTIPSELYMNAVTKKHLNITATDLDGDPIQYTFTDLPGFVSFASNSDSAWLDFKPLLSDPGYYEFIITADDGYGSPNSANMILQVEPAVLDSGRVLYRVNCSGPELEDQPINWQFDNSTDPVYGSSFSYGTGSHSWKGTNTTGAPNNLFGPFRHYGPAPRTMGWTYPLPGSGLYKLNLFFAERSTEVNNNTTGTFSISAEDSVLQQSYNIYAESGYAAAKKSFDIAVTDGNLDVLFTPILNDAKVNGFEIILLEKWNDLPVVDPFGNISLLEGDTLIIPLQVTDDHFEGCDNLSLSLQNAPAFLRIEQTGNSWQLLAMPGFNDSGNFTGIILTVTDGCLQNSISFDALVNNVFVNSAPTLIHPGSVAMNEGTVVTTTLTANDIDNQVLTFSFTGLPTFAAFQNISNGVGNLTLSPGFSQSGEYRIAVIVTDTYGASAVDTLFLTVANVTEIRRITLTASMITDLVRPPYGSSVSPNYLVDEQSLNPVTNQHPVSTSWKPYFNLSFAPYHIYFDLGEEYIIKKIYLHDMHNVANLEVSYGNPNQWKSLFTEPCNSFNAWKLHETDISTRYIRLSMLNTVYASVNEIALYGYLASEKHSEIIPDSEETGSGIYPNPCSSILNISEFPTNGFAELYVANGILSKSSRQQQIYVGDLPDGMYFVIIKNADGEILARHKLIIRK